MLQKSHVNLVDFIDHPESGVKTFPTEKALSDYTRAEGKYFPREEVETGSLLNTLLRHILNPRAERVRQPNQERGRGRRRRRGGS